MEILESLFLTKKLNKCNEKKREKFTVKEKSIFKKVHLFIYLFIKLPV